MTCCQIIVKKLQTNKEVGNVKKLIPNLGDKLIMYFNAEIFSCIHL